MRYSIVSSAAGNPGYSCYEPESIGISVSSQFGSADRGTGKICSDPDIHSAGYDILSICSKIFYEGGDDRCREGMSGKRN